MLDNLQASTLDDGNIISQLREMRTGDILAFFMRRQNIGIILTKRENSTLCESFEVSPSSDAVESTPGPLECSYPGSAAEMPNEVFDDGDLQIELASFLSRCNVIDSDPPLSAHTQCITALFTDTLQGVDHTTDVLRITKRVRDHVGHPPLFNDGCGWRRSSLWLLIRVAIQMSVDRSPFGRAFYKRFMLFFICTFARNANKSNSYLYGDQLHLMSCKILRRLSKLGSSTPDWLTEMALKTCTCLRETLDVGWSARRPSPYQNPSQDELARDTQLSLLASRDYIRNALANPDHKPIITPFHPSHPRRGTIEDLMSLNGLFFEEAYRSDPKVTLYDVERLVEQDIDNWIACITDVDEACAQLEILMDQYMTTAHLESEGYSEDTSIMFLTAVELFVALDKLVVKEIPMLAEYSPEIPMAFLERLRLRKTRSLHRLSCAYQYLSMRQSRSRPRPGWSALSNAFSEDGFAVRYYDQSPHLQHLKARIEENTMKTVSEHVGLHSESSLPSSSVYAKVVVFELQCPACFRVWRSSIIRILEFFSYSYLCSPYSGLPYAEEEHNLLVHVPELQPYFVQHKAPTLSLDIHVMVEYFHPEGRRSHGSPSLRYVIRRLSEPPNGDLKVWEQRDWAYFTRKSDHTNGTSHTPNDVLAAQANCPTDLSLDEFIAFGHLRSGGSLQWLNILRGLRSRTLNLRRHGVHHLLTQAALQVGPLDLNTGVWIWHQELQDSSFCNALLDELGDLFMDVGASLIDGVMMNTISLLLTRVLASSPSEDVSERAIALLRNVRRKTFKWVEELQYNLIMAPTNKERSRLLLDMAATCRSTFDVDTATLHKLCHSAEDVDGLLSCALFVHTLLPASVIDDEYSQLLLERDRRLSLTVEGILRDAILADPSNYGVDLAVGKIFASYQPGTHRWERLQCPNARWLTCKTEPTVDQPSQTMHVNLLDGEFRLNGWPLGGLPSAIMDSLGPYQQIFHDQGFFVVQSNLPGMDFTTLTMTREHKVHFSLRIDSIIIRAQCNQTGDILELIPSSILWNDLPPVLVKNHVHWLNLSTQIIEIRPLGQLWEESPENWRIDCASEQYRVYKGRETIVDIRSPTWAMFSKCFKCFNNNPSRYVDDSQSFGISRTKFVNFRITVSSIDSPGDVPVLRLSIVLPCHGLSFFVNEREELESSDFKNMVYDENQCIETLFGLEKLLVLRQKTHLPEELIPRCVLIPELLSEGHYHTYNVDTGLGCLIGNGNSTVMQRLADLHVETNCYRPDPLTGKTGAQAALCLFQSARCRSIMKLQALHLPKTRHRDDGFGKYPQIYAAQSEVSQRYYWDRDVHDREVNTASMKRAVQRAAYLFPWNYTGPTLGNYSDSDYLTSPVPAEPRSPTPPRLSSPLYRSNVRTPWQITLEQLLWSRPSPELPSRTTLLHGSCTRSSDDIPELKQLFSSLPMNKFDPSFQQEYITLLEHSAHRARKDSRMTYRLTGRDQIRTLESHYAQCRSNYMATLDALKTRLGPATDPREQALEQFGQWPPTTADVLLRCLASTSPTQVPPHWKTYLISLALLLVDLQRARRLLRFALDGLEEEFSKELENEGCDGWNAEEYPDWLLIQIQGNFLIRRAQVEAATQLISPQSRNNTVMQVNMGEGKSSVIIPIAAVALADGKQLVRVIVPKALTVQMFESLIALLGGLVNRPVYHLPFSRFPEYDGGKVISPQIDDLHKLMSQCVAERGILLVQPEHVVSLKLMSVEEQIRKCELAADSLPKFQRSIYKRIMTAVSLTSPPEDSLVGNIYQWLRRSPNRSSRNGATQAGHHDGHIWDAGSGSDSASKWLSLQKWIHSNVRDILDESDEILHARFQLIYTIGLPQHSDGYPDRWTIAQQVLRLVKEHVRTLSTNHPNSIEYECSIPGSFPHVRIVRASDIGRRLILLIVEDVMAGRLPGFDFRHLTPELHDAIRSFICDEDVLRAPGTAQSVEEYAKGTHQSHLWTGLLLLRGLLASNVLLFALAERRWRVDYGLCPKPSYYDHSSIHTMLAVPYRAKDVPVPNTQFGHPDITIILTCLSYYYTGLSKEQLRTSFEIPQGQDDPSTEYAHWVNEYDGTSLLDSLHKFSEINLNSSEQWDNVIFPLFSRNQLAIDFYLSRVVFPKEAKEFPWKLLGSSWDLAEKREKLITGFSGTNDGRWLLPMSIAQRDLVPQKGTNAKVLAYLLRPENDSYIVIQTGERRCTPEFLQMVAMQQPEIRVLLDVGAQILDLSNHQVAKTWLAIVREAAGAIYFNEKDELMVVTRNGSLQYMSSSPLSQQLDRCVVYLDHAHTRGTDLKLPIRSRAAVTLGPKLTKDSLVQGCMRMRKLGHGHSVMFFAPLEVDQSIRAVAANKDPNAPITIVNILCWAIHETWTDIQQRAPYWAQQGMNHKSRYEAWSRFCNNEFTPEQLSDVWLQPELKSLANLYAPCDIKNASSSLSGLDPGIHRRCKDLGVLSLPSAQMEEEQEREVNQEREREREVELPPKAEPAEHFLHPDVVKFVKTGDISPLHADGAFRHVFTTLQRSSAATVTREADVWSPFILATVDFCQTIKPESTRGTIDQYLRPVQWILTRSKKGRRDQVLVLLSPFEADNLMPAIRASEYVHLHLYAPRTSQSMKPSDDLKLYVIPPLPPDWTPPWALIDQLNVFAGQLFLRDYTSYLRLCHFLGVPATELRNDTAVQWNLFDIPGSFEKSEIRFSGSPLPSVMVLLAIRNGGQPFAETHMGKILQGVPLTEKDFEGPISAVSAEDMSSSPPDMQCDAQDSPGSSVLLRTCERDD